MGQLQQLTLMDSYQAQQNQSNYFTPKGMHKHTF